jgi:hypothetical protein
VSSLGTGFDTLLTRGALGALAAAAAWGVAVVVAVALEARSAGRIRVADRTGCPPVVRRWLLGLFLALFAGVASPAVASASGPDAGSGTGGPGGTVAASLDGLPLPDRTTGDRGSRSRTADRAVHGAVHRDVDVRAGDSLWDIARALSPDGARDSAIAIVVARLYAANRTTIGDDPDLIVPGQRLRVSPSITRPTSTPLSEDR